MTPTAMSALLMKNRGSTSRERTVWKLAHPAPASDPFTMATSGNRKGSISRVRITCMMILLLRVRSSNTIGTPFPATEVDGDGRGKREDEQDDGQRGPVADLRQRDADPVDLGPEELGGIGRTALGDQERDIEDLERSDCGENGDGERGAADTWPDNAPNDPDVPAPSRRAASRTSLSIWPSAA